jgi:hypothetical protein
LEGVVESMNKGGIVCATCNKFEGLGQCFPNIKKVVGISKEMTEEQMINGKRIILNDRKVFQE